MTVIYELGPFRLDAGTGMLSREGSPLPLGPRAVAVLTALVEHANESVPKQRIIAAAWPNMVVEDANLAVQVSSIRRVLAQVPGGERWIETNARRGYRFVGPVTRIVDASRHAGAHAERNSLPQPLTSFVGRERELAEIKLLLRNTRLLTLVGIGGIGKTRLALQVAAEMKDACKDGAWFVDLAPLAATDRVASAVAEAIGASEVPAKDPVQALCIHLKSRALLLVIDNCEHVREACARLVVSLLRTAPGCTIVATSREPLQVAGEQVYPLPTLSLPDAAASADSITSSEAVQLFMQRAQRQQPQFELTTERSSAIAALCIRLDGIPLALELAAGRIASLSVEQINARLSDRFRLLADGSPIALPRQQTLRGMLDWSHAMLTDRERVVLRRLAVFTGGFSLEAAAAVACGETMDDFAVIDVLSQLVTRSLLVADTSAPCARYRLLDTTRAYALEKLDDEGEADRLRARHARYFRDLFARAPDDWLRMSDAAWRTTYVLERDNVRSALDWAIGASAEPATGIALAGSSAMIWITLSLRDEGVQRLEAAAAQFEPSTPDADRARLWFWLAVLWDMAPLQALPAFERARDVYRSHGDALGAAHTLVRLARVLAQMGRFDESAAALRDALPVIEGACLPKILGFHCTNSGFLRMLTGDPSGARVEYQKALSLYRRAGIEFAEITSLTNLAGVNWALGDLDKAMSALRESIAMLRQSPTSRKNSLGFALANLAGVLTERGDLDEALVAAREAVPLLDDGDYAWNFLDHFALRVALTGDVAKAAVIIGCGDAIHASKKTFREPEDARARTRLQALLQEQLDGNDLARLLAEGARLDGNEACRLALEA
jgi:predicted ATPase/DNA-binding winged helix-turn-helix (wHTH) protein